MVEIKHTLCPSCSVGCGISIISDADDIDTYPYKRHPVNEGKNCLNGRNSIEIYKNKIAKAVVSNSEADCDKAIESVVQGLKSKDSDKITVICSGNNTNDEIEAIKNFAEAQNYNLIVYADNMDNCDDVASYDDVEAASKVFVIGDILYENPLAGRRIVHAKQNGATIVSNGLTAESVTFNISDECSNLPVGEFLANIKGQLDDSSVIVVNYVDSYGDFAQIVDAAKSANAKILPMYSKPNTKGALNVAGAKSKDEVVEILSNTDVLLVFNDDIADEFDIKSISTVVSFSPCENETTKASQIVVPVRSWLEIEGSFTNAMGTTQEFAPAAEICEDVLSEVEIIEKLQGEL
jgi:formate dehydrogenase major subunit